MTDLKGTALETVCWRIALGVANAYPDAYACGYTDFLPIFASTVPSASTQYLWLYRMLLASRTRNAIAGRVNPFLQAGLNF